MNKFRKSIVDFGASNHMIGDMSRLSNYSRCSKKIFVKVADGTSSKVVKIGRVEIIKELVLKDSLYILNLKLTYF